MPPSCGDDLCAVVQSESKYAALFNQLALQHQEQVSCLSMRSECTQVHCARMGLDQLNLMHPTGVEQRRSKKPLRILADSASPTVWS